jgi:hypothetical protein
MVILVVVYLFVLAWRFNAAIPIQRKANGNRGYDGE